MDAQLGAFQIPSWRTSLVRSMTAVLALAIILSAGMTVATRDTSATRIAYCATNIDTSDEPLNVSVMQQQPDAPVTLLRSATNADGCGEFQAVPRGRPVMIVVWAGDGFRTGSTGWVDPESLSGTLSIQLDSQVSPLVV